MFDDPMAMVKIYGYTQGCEACDKLKELLRRHNIEYTFIPVTKDCPHRRWVKAQGYNTVPQVWMDQTYIGNYGSIKNHLEPTEAHREATSLLGWIPAPPPKLTESTPAESKTVEEKTARKRKAKEPKETTRAEACFINPLTGQKECS